MSIIKIFSVLLLFLIPQLSFGADTNEEILRYLPFFKGSSWSYSTSDGEKEIFQVKEYKKLDNVVFVACESNISGLTNFIFTKDKLYRFKTLSSSRGKISFSNGLLLLSSPLTIGKIWESNIGETGAIHVEVLAKENISTPAGDFKETIKVGIRYPNNPIYDGIVWFAKDVGIVQTLENHFSKTLISYSLGAKDLSIINSIDSKYIDSKLVLTEQKSDENVPPPPIGDYYSIKNLLRSLNKLISPLNLFALITLVVLFIFVFLLARITHFFKNEVANGNFESKKNLANTYLSTGRFQKAEKILNGIIKKNPLFPDLLNSLGVALIGQKKFTNAIDFFKKAVEINPDYSEAKINLAKSLFSIGKTSDAENILFELLDKNPNYSDLHNLIAEIYMSRNELKLAKDHLEKAIKINPGYIKALENLKRLENQSKGEGNE